ncbi:MAG: hypothetical protein E6Q97_17850 [Desulfurellales bacterium]|nr:MAG: hypothetical protein E6Q97_17850 [Desulfurellales bacterium]
MKDLTEAAIPAIAQKTSIMAGIVSFLGALSAEWVFGISGLLVSITALLVQRHYTQKKDRREADRLASSELRAQELHKARIEFLRRAEMATAIRGGLTPHEMDAAEQLGLPLADFVATDIGETSDFTELK